MQALLIDTMARRTCVIARDVLDIHRNPNRDGRYHLVFTNPGKYLQDYLPDRYLSWINSRIEHIVKLDLDVTIPSPEKYHTDALVDPRIIQWEDRYRKWEVEVTAVNAPFDTYEIASLFPEVYKAPIFPENASKFLHDFQNEHPDLALHVKLRWRREDEMTKMCTIQVAWKESCNSSNETCEKYRIDVRKAGKGVIKKLVKTRGLKNKKGIVALAKEELVKWEKRNGNNYVAVLTQSDP